MNTNNIAMNKGNSKIHPRTKEQEAQLEQDMKDIAYFMHWRRKYYEMEPEGQDLKDLERDSA